MRFLILRFDAPLMSFGAARVDQRGLSQAFPGLSLLTGLIANALGLSHSDFDELNDLQGRLRYAVRRDRRPRPLLDYQTVDLGQPHLVGTGWTTRGELEERGGGSDEGTHIRYQSYWSDGVYTIAVHLSGEGKPDLDDLEHALKEPERPLFLGRKACLPAAPILHSSIEADDLLDALRKVDPLDGNRGDEDPLTAWWPEDLEAGEGKAFRFIEVSDARDWRSQVHLGRRRVMEGQIEIIKEAP